MDEISIDRLIFDIHGLNATQARDLAQRVGEGLAGATSSTQRTFDALAVNLNYPASSEDIPRLAESIIGALLAQMGGR
jgi:hypothetical protein